MLVYFTYPIFTDQKDTHTMLRKLRIILWAFNISAYVAHVVTSTLKTIKLNKKFNTFEKLFQFFFVSLQLFPLLIIFCIYGKRFFGYIAFLGQYTSAKSMKFFKRFKIVYMCLFAIYVVKISQLGFGFGVQYRFEDFYEAVYNGYCSKDGWGPPEGSIG